LRKAAGEFAGVVRYHSTI